MPKLTLSVDAAVVTGAKRYAQSRGTSVSRLVETMLRLVSAQSVGRGKQGTRESPPVLARLRGSLKLKRGDVRDYQRHLARKYR
jgi:hypothetical protein